jgi:hypothetical protein
MGGFCLVAGDAAQPNAAILGGLLARLRHAAQWSGLLVRQTAIPTAPAASRAALTLQPHSARLRLSENAGSGAGSGWGDLRRSLGGEPGFDNVGSSVDNITDGYTAFAFAYRGAGFNSAASDSPASGDTPHTLKNAAGKNVNRIGQSRSRKRTSAP